MKNRFFIVVMLFALLVTFASSARANSPASIDPKGLVYVLVNSPDDLTRFASTNLPMYALLETGLLAGANIKGQQALDGAGLRFQVIDLGPLSGTYYLAEIRPSRKAPDFSLYGQVLLEMDNGVLLRMDSSMAETLAQAGAELQLITLTPKPIPSRQSEAVYPEVIDPDPLIQLMLDQVTQEDVYEYDRGLAGEEPVWVDGGFYTITSRRTDSGINIQKATSYVGQHMADLGLDVEYHVWNNSTNPNVIGEIPGLINPDDIFIIGGHVDDVQSVPGGADDNASGSVAAMIAADILSQYQWGCTLRFAVWTGEEQGLLGSAAYAQQAYNAGENILGYLNLDMIAWNTIGSSTDIDLIYRNDRPPTQQLAQLFADVVDAYNINLIPELRTSLSGGSDHSSFWNYGYTSILAIEDQSDFNPYYHSSYDTSANTDPTYFTNFVKASIGTFAHMTDCLIPNGIGNLDGHVTAASGGAPIEGVMVTADDGLGHSFSEITDATGYYTRTLLAGTYDVSASIYGYLPATVSGVEVITDTVTTQDFALTALPTYMVSGYVTDLATNEPLDAQVEFLDAPVPPVYTDPSTGFYSIEVAEGTWTMRATAANHSPQTVTIDVNANTQQDFNLYPLCDVLTDDVENGNIGWTAQYPWAITTESFHSPTHSWTDSPGGNYQNNANTSLTSPVLDLSDYTGLSLRYWQTYSTEAGYDYAKVEYSTDGGSTWTSATSFDGVNLTWTQQEISLPELDGETDARIRFHLTSDYYIVSDGWHIDDIALNGGGPGCLPPDQPISGLTATSTSPDQLSETTTLTATVTGGTNIVYTWDFGDGDTGDGAVVTHEYTTAGAYEAMVTATNLNDTDIATTTVHIDMPITGLTAINDSPTKLGEATTFTAAVTGGTNVVYTWDFGDGEIGDGVVVTHVYVDPGNYTATVTASNSLGSMEAETVAVIGSIRFYLPFIRR